MKFKKLGFKNLSKRKQAIAFVCAILLLFVLVFLVSSYFISNKQESDSATKPNPQVVEKYRLDFVNLGNENVDLTAKALVAELDSTANAPELKEQMRAKGKEISSSVGTVYGKEGEKTFDQGLNVFYEQIFNYAKATKNKDDSAREEAISKLENEFSKPIAEYLAKSNNDQKQTLRTGLDSHAYDMAVLVNYHLAGKSSDRDSQISTAKFTVKSIYEYIATQASNANPSAFQ